MSTAASRRSVPLYCFPFLRAPSAAKPSPAAMAARSASISAATPPWLPIADGRSLRLYRSASPYGPRYTSGLSELIVQGGGVAYWTREGRPQRICSPN